MAIVEIKNWCISAEGQSISCIKSTLNSIKPILLIGGVHGDEPEGVELACRTLDWLKTETSKNPTAVYPWIVIPCLNPDGYRKNQRVNANGVDLNRNYPSRDWTKSYKEPRYFPGHSPGSELEIKSLTTLIAETQPLLIIHCHSWHPCIVYAGDAARTYATALSETTGYELKNDIGYPTPGSLSSYAWGDHRIPVICIEEKEKIDRQLVWPNFSAGMKQIFLKNGDGVSRA